MLTLPDFREKHILYVQAEYRSDNLLQLTNDNIRFVRDGEAIDQMSCHTVLAVFIVGEMSITTALLKKLTSYGISVFFLNHNLRTLAAVMAESEGNYLLRQKQYTTKDDLYISSAIIKNKIRNQQLLLEKYKKPYDHQILDNALNMLAKIKDKQQLLGVEGIVSKTYFGAMFQKLNWLRRAPQTREDIINLLLDIGYTYLFNLCDSLLRLFGFDTYKGYYHQLFFQRKSLACDIMEPLRPLIDRQLLKSYHLGQIKEKDFLFRNGRFEFKKGFVTSKKYSSVFLEAIDQNKEEIYLYILAFYRYIMNKKKYPFPEFQI
ncbi:CRISPR-associated endonuclease Cas1 [Candidatus Gottesmanbacteria bacterium CG11_big_fil_rev_8_21_14_0_20_37_11]|uniref:CRISPR-associated endonuclease Cas1 n=3 Tax=Candidatus Gottesmaniibacteriota TaxID=1752720 RepID=A0A2M7RRE6_9BACT|nr:MAG: CRISPR-associated endonuclease Cas1 [Candidatus Gottesmanbacteria bacterium CG1_02_37_22]PIP32530.1 MAG: CRISPR-associated endonuclease Cas1 [Candidatus Gottesmanbacteria bacterium CG23_combo_of_CG06-09_8_20_14_all_37_19]PIR07834.1 MAG: CRISPR-associated endonuclease Cas1 [Candidatus Gottesmanbacteria bacterium CG11_big_fil_rev_8_21_14_0_20_37_11]PIZ02852.1 MAG: CRISPR-associated endonuclease Cas1 [Candidatus Gottesmanbacteria bacterium CG_4_10_14_0_8_um_filter_37_24]